MAESELTQRDIFCTIIAEVTGNPVSYVEEIFEEHLRPLFGPNIDDPISKTHFERTVAQMRLEKKGILKWLEQGGEEASRLLRLNARDN